EEVAAQVKLGYKSSLELFSQESSYQSAINGLEKIKWDLEQSRREIRHKLALAEGREIVLLELVKPEIWTVAEEDVSRIISSNTLLDIRKRQVEVARGDLERARVAGVAEVEIRKKELALARAELELEKERQNQELKINNAYHQYTQAVKNMNMAEKSLLQAEEHYKIIKEQNEAGFVSNNDLLASELSLYKARDMYINTISNYYIALIQLQQLMGIEMEVDLG
ncbi:MAG: TolC family protein, partial [Halanaerobiales bacterium]